MEALIAVGLAGNVVQFVLCLGTLAKEAKSINDTGSTEEVPAIKVSTQHVINQAMSLKARMKAFTATLAEEDQVRILTGFR